MTPQARSGHLAMLCFSVLVAGSFALGVLAANDITPLALNAVRFWIASAIIGFLVALRGGVPRAALTAPWRYLVLASALTFYFVMMFEGLKTAPSVSAAAVFTLTPMIAAGFGWLLLGQRMHRRIKVALAIGAVGALWVIFRADVAALMRFEVGRGEMIYFTGCVSHALYTPLVRKLNRGESALVFTFGTLVTGAVILTIVGWSDLRATDWANLPAIVWITILYTAIFASAATFTLLQFSAMRLPAAKAMAYTYLVPSWVIVWSVALGAAVPPLAIFGGVALTIVALFLLLRDDG
ncbi:MAG: DMT family transporter [Loktanella sp.]|jgi:drug/metabolite transporter (DMT)-like permease|nr:DMT family transporter [Loktanella sp.]MDO7606774.1 DMT family transporter [Loktanella sp.]MDO7624083.1 DMT family transporter [Loktanella sp.]MDO7624665.1 DMT family transporter [Loktanella sp.]MDO7665880.1 DMT family transporter [Loktanella sp.]